MKIHIPAFVPMLKANEHLAHGPLDIDLGENVVEVIRCKNCDYYAKSEVCTILHTEPAVIRTPDDFCSKAVKRR